MTLIGQAADGRAQHAYERQAIIGIFDGAQQVDRIDDFFGGIEMALAFDDVTNAAAPKGSRYS